MTSDEKKWGADKWVYCKSHVAPHRTGWCTVPVQDKTILKAATADEALDESRSRGFPIHGDKSKR